MRTDPTIFSYLTTMESLKMWMIVALAILSACGASKTPIPEGKEVIYDYKALVKAGTHVPVEFASAFYLHGKLHMQKGDHFALCKLSDLYFKLYTGEIEPDFEHEVEKIPLTPETQDLMNVFKIHYNESGKAVGITTEDDEKEYSRNIKKAIASIMQLDFKNIKIDSVKPHAFSTIEDSIYGKHKTLYDVLPEEDNKLIITKMHEMKTTKHMYQFMITNLEVDTCEAPYEDPMSHDSQRVYTIKVEDGHPIIKHIETYGGIYSYPLKAKSELHYIYINQTFELKEMVPIKDQFKVKKEHKDEDLTYHMHIDMENGAVPDLTNGRRDVDMKKVSDMCYKMVEEIVDYLGENQLLTKIPDIEKGQLINRVLRLFVMLDKPTLEKVYKMVAKDTDKNKKMVEVFYELLPLMGTPASMHLIKKLVHEKTVSEMIATEMLHYMPFYVKVPTEKFLHEMEDMLHWGEELSWGVRKMAILSFATLMHKTYKFQERIHKHHQHTYEHDDHKYETMHEYWEKHTTKPFWLKKSDEHYKIYEKYVTEFVDKLKTVKDYDIKMTYLMALYNTKLDMIVKYLMPIVKGEWFDDINMKRMAMTPLGIMISRDSDEAFEVFWPIFTNPHEPTEIRITAYMMLMKSHPSMSRLENMFWFLEKDHNSELYHFHYNFLKSWSHSKDPCHKTVSLWAYEQMKFMRKPTHHGFMSTYMLWDYTDPEFGFGGSFNTMFINTNTSVMFRYETKSRLFNLPIPAYSMYVSIHGLDQRLASKFHLMSDSTSSFFNMEEMWNLFKSIPDMKHIDIKVIVLKQRQVVRSYYLNAKNINLITPIFDFFNKQQFAKDERHLHIEYNIFNKVFMPTELGTVAVMDILMPVVEFDKIDMKKEVVNNVVNVHLDNYHHTWRHSRFGLTFYNPFADIWQGINRYTSYDSVMPLFMDVGVNTQQHSMKMVMKRHKDMKKDIMGARAHATNLVFAKDDFDHKYLTKSCPKCEEFVVVSKGEKFRNDYVFEDTENYNTGYHYFKEIFDSEHHATNSSWQKFSSMMMTPYTKNFKTPIGHFMLFMRNWYVRAITQPKPGRCGSIMMWKPSTKTPVTEIDLTVRLNSEYKHEKDEYLPGMKFNTRATYSLKNEEKTVKTWDISAVMDLNPGHTINNWKMQITRILPGSKDFSMCMEGVKKWTSEKVDGHMTIGMSQSSDGKCSKDDTVVDVTMVGERLKEQDSPYHEYGVCSPYLHKGMLDYHHMACAAAHTSFRKYTYDIKTKSFPQEFKKYVTKYFDMMKSWYMPYYTFVDEHHEKIEENTLKVEVEYPMVGFEVDVSMKSPHHEYKFTGIPYKHLTYFGVWPDNTYYSKMFTFMHTMGLTKTCTVYPDHVDHDHSEMVPFKLPKEWTMYVGDVEKDAKHGLWVKDIEGSDKMAIKVTHGTHTLEIYPVGEHVKDFKFMIDGKEIKDHDDSHFTEWFTFVVLKDYEHKVILTTHHFSLHMVYDGYHVYAEMPKLDHPFHGHCFTK